MVGAIPLLSANDVVKEALKKCEITLLAADLHLDHLAVDLHLHRHLEYSQNFHFIPFKAKYAIVGARTFSASFSSSISSGMLKTFEHVGKYRKKVRHGGG